MQNALTRPSPPLIINSFDKRYIILQYLEKYAIFLLARIMKRHIFADKKDLFLKFLSIWSWAGDRNLIFPKNFFSKICSKIIYLWGFYGSLEIFGQFVFVVTEIIECGFFRGVCTGFRKR